MTKRLKKIYSKDGQDRLLPRFSLYIFDRSRTMAILWLLLMAFGVLCYTTLMKREGFPNVNVPFTTISGTYIVNDSARVDRELSGPISDIVLKDDHVKSVQSQAQASFYNVMVQYKDGTNAGEVSKTIERQIRDARILPAQASIKVENPKFGFTKRGDNGVISVYAKTKGASLHDQVNEAHRVADYINAQHFSDLQSISVINPFIEGTNPVTGKQTVTQMNFDRYGIREGSSNNFYDAVSVGYSQKTGSDVIKLDDHLRKAVAAYNAAHANSTFKAAVSASYANDIRGQIGELQRALLEGLTAVLIIGSIIIAVRASIITVISMLTVLAIAVGALYLFGYTLNTITLFALILCLGLIVDDTIIMIEAIDAQRRRLKDPRETVRIATRKVSRAMVAATLTAALSFSPLLFVGGILGSFIRAIPITVILSLLVSLLVALVFIPLLARYLLLGKKHMGKGNEDEPAAGIEAKIATFIGKPMLWAQHSRKKLFAVGITAVVIGFAFIGAGGYLFQKVTFNIFPPTKDSNGLIVQLAFPPGTTIGQAEQTADKANKIIGDTLGGNFTSAAYYANANVQQASMTVYLIPYTQRNVRAPQLTTQLEDKLKNFQGAKVKVHQNDVGPPASAFAVHIQTDDREAALRLAKDMRSFLANREITRPNGKQAKVTETTISDPGIYTRAGGKSYIEVGAFFDGTDTTTLVTLAKSAVDKEFTADKLSTYGLGKDVLKYDFGQEQQNQDSFKTLALAFPVVLLAIYLLLVLQFRSLAQPLLIFMAIPFSLFGITLGLYMTHNAFSFFAMLGFFALIGLSIKNTILLTDYANQLRHSGSSAVDAAVGALAERFRPLVATSLTTAVSLVPLALTSPFWEGLMVVLIFGLLSSTFLVITVFPYYYLGAEFVRLSISRRTCLTWLALTTLISVALIKLGATPGLIPLVAIGLTILQVIISKVYKRRTTS